MRTSFARRLAGALLTPLFAVATLAAAKEVTLLNVSYDPTREFYEEYNQAFAKYWRDKTGDEVRVNQSHGGSGKQARAVIDGLDADVVTLALAYDVDQLYSKGKLIPGTWQSQLPYHSAPYTSTIVFVVRQGNPLNIRDWDDLAKPGVGLITPNPKTSGGARWNYLAAWGFARRQYGSEQAAKEFVAKLFKNAVVLDSGARGSTTTFVEREIGDVLITWENEAHLIQKQHGADRYPIVTPSLSILAEPPVAVVETVARQKGTTAVAKAYLEYLYSKEGQKLAAKHFYRPRDQEVAAEYAATFPRLQLFTIDEMFGGWNDAQATHFNDHGSFDEIYGTGK